MFIPVFPCLEILEAKKPVVIMILGEERRDILCLLSEPHGKLFSSYQLEQFSSMKARFNFVKSEGLVLVLHKYIF